MNCDVFMVKDYRYLLLLVLLGLFVFGCLGQVQQQASAQPQPPPQPPPEVQPPSNDIGLSEADLPGFTDVRLSEAGRKTLADFPEATRESLGSYGFESYYLVILQKPPLQEGAVPDADFRQIQSGVSTFTDAAGARKAFEAELDILRSNNIEVASTDLGERGFFYLSVYTDQNGIILEQHTILFLKGERYALVSLTATEREDSKELSNLLAQAAVSLEEKMPS